MTEGYAGLGGYDGYGYDASQDASQDVPIGKLTDRGIVYRRMTRGETERSERSLRTRIA